MKKGLMFILALEVILALTLIKTISADISFSQNLNNVYNLGDIINIGIEASADEEGPLKVDLTCDDKTLGIYNGPVMDNIPIPLNSLWINDMTGECYFSGKSGDNNFGPSKNFKISDKLEVELDIVSITAKPSDEITITGTAKRENGNPITGTVEITIPISTQKSETEVATDNPAETITNESGNETITEESLQQDEIETTTSDNGKYYGEVIDGKFSVTFSTAKDTPSGKYKIDVLVYEKDKSGEKTSEGLVMGELNIAQVLTSADIAIDSQNLNPGETLNIKPLLLDQTGILMSEEVSVIIKDKEKNRVFEKLIKAGETIEYKIPTNRSAGYYEIEVSTENISALKKFYINEKAILSFELINDTLIVTNMGNIPYKKDFQIELNGKPFVKRVNLDLGENKKYKLSGNGAVDIKVSDGESLLTQSGVALTGHAISVEDVKEGGIKVFNTPIFWIFFILIIAGITLFFFRNIFKKKSFAYPTTYTPLKKAEKKEILAIKSPLTHSPGAQRTQIQKSQNQRAPIQDFRKSQETTQKTNVASSLKEPMKDNLAATKKFGTQNSQKEAPFVIPAKAPDKAEQVMVLKGQKNRATVIALKIKNKVGSFAKQGIESSIEHVYEKKGAVYEQGDFIFIIFSPLVTRSFKNEVEASKVAEKIVDLLKEHNRKFKDPIEFGIGINSGEIISKVEDKRLKFTALGNLIILAKRLASSSDGNILLSKEAYSKASTEIKADKKMVNGAETYEVKRVVDREKNQQFIDNFLRREKTREVSSKR
jgi:hypothetical protein